MEQYRHKLINPDADPEKEGYRFADGWVMSREWDTEEFSRNGMRGHWVLRDADGKVVDYDSYRNDLAERYGLELG